MDYDEIRGVLATVLWLDTIGQVIVDTRKFSGPECYTVSTILDQRQLTWELVNS